MEDSIKNSLLVVYIVAIVLIILVCLVIGMPVGLALLLILAETVAFIVDAIISYQFEKIARMKGHKGYFWWCFILEAIGWAMVIALPDRNGSPSAGNSSAESDDALPEL